MTGSSGGDRVTTNTCAENYKFTGLERDSETGNDHTWFRYYGSNMGRWLSPDPLGGDVTNPQSLNRYAYVLNNPTNFIDPLGLDECDPGADCVTVTSPPPPPIPTNFSPGQGPGGVDLPFFLNSAGALYDPPGLPLIVAPRLQGGVRGPGSTPGTPTPQQAPTQGCEEQGQLAFNIPFTKIPVTVSVSFTLFNVNISLNRDVSAVIPTSVPPLSFGLSADVNINAPAGFAPTVNVGSGRNLGVGTFLTPNGPKGFTFSVGPSVGPPVSVSEPVGNLCGKSGG